MRSCKISQANSKWTSAYPTKFARTPWFQLSPLFACFCLSRRSHLRPAATAPAHMLLSANWYLNFNQLTKQILLLKFYWSDFIDWSRGGAELQQGDRSQGRNIWSPLFSKDTCMCRVCLFFVSFTLPTSPHPPPRASQLCSFQLPFP